MSKTHSPKLSLNHLSKDHCVPCEGSTAPLTHQEEDAYRSSVPSWSLERDQAPHTLSITIVGKNFGEAVDLVNAIAEIAEEEGHHPDLYLHDYKKLTITLYTHAITGLSMNDFIMAAKINEILPKVK